MSTVSLAIGLVYVVFTVVDFVVAYGLWVGKRWAWVISIILSVFGIITAVFTLFLRPRAGEVLALLIDLVIIFYLIQPRVQAYYGQKSTAVVTPTEPGNGGSKLGVSSQRL
jgi:uncharacterized membrane protein (DUF2068 family)